MGAVVQIWVHFLHNQIFFPIFGLWWWWRLEAFLKVVVQKWLQVLFCSGKDSALFSHWYISPDHILLPCGKHWLGICPFPLKGQACPPPVQKSQWRQRRQSLTKSSISNCRIAAWKFPYFFNIPSSGTVPACFPIQVCGPINTNVIGSPCT